MQDIQKEKANRAIFIDQVGVTDIKYPLKIKQKDGGLQSTVTALTLSVSLPKEFKGTHMSRFIKILREYEFIDTKELKLILSTMKENLQAESAFIRIEFPYFLHKFSPISTEFGLMDYNCAFSAGITKELQETALIVKVPVTAVCPCSKSISDRGAHNQRGIIEIKVGIQDRKETLWIEDLIELAENSGSCAVYPVLKREDEKYVTEKAYDNPVFVEDMVREVAWKLKEMDLRLFEVKSTNQESIHNHSAFARIVFGNFELL